MTRTTRSLRRMAAPLALSLFAAPAAADPCGMVPPPWVGDGPAISRVGKQLTYVFHRDWIETIALRPSFEGKVERFGMLIPFPDPPAVRKVADDVFEQLARAIDPPEVLVNLNPMPRGPGSPGTPGAGAPTSGGGGGGLRLDEVRVVSREAVGMYDVAVLEAGSAAALRRWMTDNDFVFPDGMEPVCQEYVDEAWCFVAVKTRVGAADLVAPRPGMRDTDESLPEGASFTGAVQAMAFRFRSEVPVVPMRLSTFNEGDPRNIVYALTEGPVRVAGLDADFVRRQVSGEEVLENLTELLPLRIVGGDHLDLSPRQLTNLRPRRDPTPQNGAARDLLVADLLAARVGALSHPFEAREKDLLAIGEVLGLREGTDPLLAEALAPEVDFAAAQVLDDLREMTLTVIDGDFDRELLAAQNLALEPYEMDASRNDRVHYDAVLCKAAAPKDGERWSDHAPADPDGPGWEPAPRDGDAPATLEAYLARRGTERLVLRRAVERGADVRERGLAVIGLARLEPDVARRELARLAGPDLGPPLVRTWVDAARLAVAADAESAVGTLRDDSHGSLGRPLAFALQRDDAELGTAAALDALLALGDRREVDGELVVRALETLGAEALVALWLGAESDGERRRASSWLAALGSGAEKEAAVRAVLDALAFPEAGASPPWGEGALFVPGMAFTRSEARDLTDTLVRWLLAAELADDAKGERRVVLALRSLSLANLAGYSFPVGDSAATWLRAWGEAAGRDAVETILLQQDAAAIPRFREVLDRLARDEDDEDA